MLGIVSASLPRPRPPGGRGARGRILEAARILFHDRGINVTGVAELAAGAQVSKRTLYQHFASKDELVRAYLADVEVDETRGPATVLARSDLAPRARLLEVFSALGEGPRPLRGDPFLAAAVELADPRHPAHRLAAARWRRLAERLGELAHEAGARDAERLGRRLALLYAGAASQTVVQDDSAPAEEARMIAALLLSDAIE